LFTFSAFATENRMKGLQQCHWQARWLSPWSFCPPR